MDNLRIDVALPQAMYGAARQLVRAVLRDDVKSYFWREALHKTGPTDADAFRNQHAALSRAILEAGDPLLRMERVQLYQLAVLKLLLTEVDVELRALRLELEQSKERGETDGRTLAVHQRLVVLARFEPAIRYRAANRVVRILSRLEFASLHKRRRAVLGVSWPLPAGLLFNPLLQLGGVGNEDEFAALYPLYLRTPQTLSRFNVVCRELLQPWLPDSLGPPGAGFAAHGQAPGTEALRGLVEIEERLRQVAALPECESHEASWCDRWENLVLLLGGATPPSPADSPWQHPQWPGFQRDLRRRFAARFRAAGLEQAALAAYELGRVHEGQMVPGQSRLIFEALTGQLSRRACARRLDGMPAIRDRPEFLRRLDRSLRSVRRASGEERRGAVVRAVGDFTRFRHDLKLAWQALQAMDRLRLVEDAEELAMARENRLLQRFGPPGEALGDARPVIGHVVLKADVRGSTELTARMQQAGLNPATYFSRNLFDPINGLSRDFGAEKVFVEGDAVILILVERANEPVMAVARACGLARKILQVVEAGTGRNRQLGLPELELGIGIAYVDQAPAYLFDEGRRITISPAINRADRLSSCHPQLRRHGLGRGPAGRGVEVAVPPPPPGVVADIDAAEELWRYNVNGVELDAPAFFRLRSEVRLAVVRLRSTSATRYHVGRYPDLRGGAHWLAVREAPIRRWDGDGLRRDGAGQRRFYEVVTDRTLLRRLRRRLQAVGRTVREATGESREKTG